MLRALTVAFLACWTLSLHASPIVYATSQFNTAAVASVPGDAGADFGSSPTDDFPLVTSAAVFNAADLASAGAIAAPGLLTAQTDASSATGMTSATATAQFIGTFNLPVPTVLKFFIDLIDEDFTDANAFSDASLFLTLTLGGITYADRLFTGTDSIFFTVDIPSTGIASLDLFLSSEASTMAGGSASNFAQAQFLVVPEPGALGLLLAGVGLLGWVTRRRQSVPCAA